MQANAGMVRVKPKGLVQRRAFEPVVAKHCRATQQRQMGFRHPGGAITRFGEVDDRTGVFPAPPLALCQRECGRRVVAVAVLARQALEPLATCGIQVVA